MAAIAFDGRAGAAGGDEQVGGAVEAGDGVVVVEGAVVFGGVEVEVGHLPAEV